MRILQDIIKSTEEECEAINNDLGNQETENLKLKIKDLLKCDECQQCFDRNPILNTV